MEDWLHRKAEENAHNEIGFFNDNFRVTLLTGGLLAIIIAAGEPNWLLSFPYMPLQASPTYLGLILTVAGFAVLATGFVLVMHYDRKRSWYIKEIEKSSMPKKWKTNSETVDQILEEYSGKRKKTSG